MKANSESSGILYENLLDSRFDHVYRARFSKGVRAGRDEVYYVKLDTSGEIDFFAMCRTSVALPSCSTAQELIELPGISIEYDIPLEKIGMWKSIRESIETLVKGFVVDIETPASDGPGSAR